MRYRASVLTLLLFLPVLLNPNSVSQTPAESSEKPLYQTKGNEATLFGTITVKGTRPKLKTIDMAADPVCGEINHNREPEWLLTNDDKLLNAFVYVTGYQLKAHRFELPGSDVAMQRVNCQFFPRVVGLRVGQNLQIWNRDPTYHNTHPTPKLNVEWNQTQAPQTAPLIKTFAREEALIPFKCNQHPWERAYVGVMNHPFFAVSNELGSYEIRGLPPGTYKFVAWHEAFDEQVMEITLAAGENRRIDFTFNLDEGLKKTWPYSPMGSER
jgi:hypothetical protein